MSDIALSVIVPFYNRENLLPECLASIEHQTLTNIEIICIDDGSTDASAAVIQHFTKQDNRFKLFQLSKNQGASAARNYAIEQAQGEFLIFMDSDDWYPRCTTLEALYLAATSHKVAIAGGSFSEYHSETGKITTDFSYNEHLARNFTFAHEGFMNYRDWQGDYGYTRFIYQRDLILKHNIRFPNYKRQEDPIFFVRAMLAAKEFYALPEVVYCCRTKEAKRSNFMPLEVAKDGVAAICELIELAAQENLPLVRSHQYELITQYAFEYSIWRGYENWKEISAIVKEQIRESTRLRVNKLKDVQEGLK